MLRLVTLTAMLALAACANSGDEGFIVLNNTAVTGSCSLTGSTSQPFISHGQIYAKSTTGYLLTPLIQSRISAGTGSADVDPTTRTIYLTGANVSLEVKATSIEHADGSFGSANVTLSGQQAQFSALFSASLPPGGTVNVGFEVIPVQTLRAILTASGAAATDKMNAEVLATVTVLGMMGGDQLSAQPFQFPITVCNNCVVVNNGACPFTGTVRTGNACNIFQDGIVDCCTDATNNLICPATTM